MITLNLLPPDEKRGLYFQRISRLLWFYGGQILIAFFIFVLLSWLVWFFLNSQAKIIETELSSYEAGIKKEALTELNKKITEANAQIEAIDKIQATHQYFSLIFTEIAGLIPEEAYLESINIQKQPATEKEIAKTKIILSGYAPLRDNVIQIKKNLEKSIYFEELESPMSNFVKATDINFTFSAVIKETQLKK